MFPGQGSQKKGMGEGLFEKYADLTAKADDILGYSIKALCLEDADENLMQTQYTQPALYTVSALTYLEKLEETGEKPTYVAGHSLGEYNALFAAGAFDFETGLKLVKRRGELMAQAGAGGMAAVIRLDEEAIARVLKDNNLTGIDVANFNSPDQIVISGPKEDIEKAQPFFEEAGAMKYAIIKVRSAFHSRYMKEARDAFAQFLADFQFNDLQIKTLSNVTARPYKSGQIKDLLADQINHSVNWTECVRYLLGKGEETFTEIGPGRVLTGLFRKIKKLTEPLIVDDEQEEEPAPAAAPQPVAVPSAVAEPAPAPSPANPEAAALGSVDFRETYGLKYAYVAGAMFRNISTPDLVVQMGQAGLLGFLGTGGVEPRQIEADLSYIQGQLSAGQAYGAALICDLTNSHAETACAELLIKQGVRNVEAQAYMQITPALAHYRLTGLRRGADGQVEAPNRVIAKVTRPEVARVFMSPAPERVVNKLLEAGKITQEEATLSKEIPMAGDICVEADSGGPTDQGVAYTLMPAMNALRTEMLEEHGFKSAIRLGAAGGIGTPEAAAAALVLGAEFIMTGSINQCTVQSGASDRVKDMLQGMNVQDTAYAPAGDMFEVGARIQVLKKGLFFPARANKLYNLYLQYNALEEIDDKTRKQIQDKYFKRSFDQVWEEVRQKARPEDVEKAERNPKNKMAMIFKWYFEHAHELAITGSMDQKVDYQVHCGPSLGAFNQWVKGSSLESWRNRHVQQIAEKLMVDTAALLKDRFRVILGN